MILSAAFLLYAGYTIASVQFVNKHGLSPNRFAMPVMRKAKVPYDIAAMCFRE